MSPLPYRMEVSWDQTYNDVYLVDLQSGKPTKVLEHWGSNQTSLSPGGNYVLYFDENAGHWWTYRVADGTRTNITERIKVRFQQDFTTPTCRGRTGAAPLAGPTTTSRSCSTMSSTSGRSSRTARPRA